MTTFERLAVLLFLRERAPEEFGPQAISNRLHIHPDLVREALHGLEAKGLLCAAGGDSFRFAPATPALADTVEAFVVAYREQSAAVLSTMSIYAIERIRSGPIRAFADSFVLGKRKDDG
jgi:DNA-binding GntR family transcriptional regulator